MRTLITLTLSGSALALVLSLLNVILGRKISKTVYYYAWLLVLLRFLLPLPGLVPVGSRDEAPAASVQAAMREKPLPVSAPVSGSGGYEDFWRGVSAQEQHTGTPAVQHTMPKLRVSWKDPKLWLSIWAAGAAVCFLSYTVSYFRFTRRLRLDVLPPRKRDLMVYQAIPGHKPVLWRCRAVRTPMMLGILRPRILLPEREYEDEVLRNILRHELMHYRRKDTLYKWFSVLVYSAQWFNPLILLIRTELNRACELSCDEMLLHRMDRQARQSYGETLLSMAANASLPAGIVATTFATEKKTLKERLVQIMDYKLNRNRILASCLAVLVLISCAVLTGPRSYAEEAAPASAPSRTVEVSTVDELITAIAPDTEIILAPGVYDLSEASTYGKVTLNPNCYWEEQYDGPQLVIHGIANFSIRGAGREETTIAAVPRYASVLFFENCEDLTLAGFTAGHTQEPGYCAGDVLSFVNASRVRIDDCGMYGCGVIGLSALHSSDFTVTASEIYSCSYGAVALYSCRNFLMDGCTIRDHASATEAAVSNLFYLDSTEGFTVRNSVIRNNYAQNMLVAGYSRNVVFAGNAVKDNAFLSAVFSSRHYSPVVEGCGFENNSIYTWVEGNGVFPVDASGNKLGKPELESMVQRTIEEGEALFPAKTEAETSVSLSADGCYHVSTVDEFLAALGSERTIILDAEIYDLSTASDYGSPGGTYYFWKESYDGPELVITDVHDLTIDVNKETSPASQAALHHTITAMPRYANVLSFQYCDDIALLNFTAGHTEEPGECSGGVLYFQNCSTVSVAGCRLYGCGILGIDTSNCSSISIDGTEIYDCSQGGANFWNTDGISFDDCSIHDVNGPSLSFSNCGDKTWNGKPISGLDGQYDFAEDGSLRTFDWDAWFAASYPQDYQEPEEVDPAVALVWARGELKRMQDLGILSRGIVLDGELEYAAYAEHYADNDDGRYSRDAVHGFYARDYSGKYMINFFIDDTVTGDVRMMNIEAAADPDEPHNDMDPIDLGNGLYYYYDNFDDIFPADLTLGSLCDRLAAYWGYSGWTLSGTKDDFYGLDTEAPSPDLLVSELPEDNYYVTAYFEGDQEGAPMYIQICHLPGRVYFGAGESHLVG